MSKGESDLVLPSSLKGEIVGIMIQVLSFMAIHSDDRSQYNRLTTQRSTYQTTNNEERGIRRFTLTKLRINVGSLYTSSVYVHMHFHKRESAYTLKI